MLAPGLFLSRYSVCASLPPFLGSSHLVHRTIPFSSTHTSDNSTLSVEPTFTAQAEVWQLDFFSRPILDERGKNLWELLITDSERTFVFSQFFANNKINSRNLKDALCKFLDISGSKRPLRCRFFRGQMSTIISRALTDLDIKPVPSRRCYSLMDLIKERVTMVYTQHPGYSDNARVPFTFDFLPLRELPDALRGEQWALVQLPVKQLQREAEDVRDNKVFGSTFMLSERSKNINLETFIPGVVMFSRRATPLAASTNGLDLAAITADVDRACLILETGFNQRWRYGSYLRTALADEEAQAWENAKKFVDGLHFLAIQPEPNSQEVAGLWFMQAIDPQL